MESQGIKVRTTYSKENLHIHTKRHGNPSNCCQDVSLHTPHVNLMVRESDHQSQSDYSCVDHECLNRIYSSGTAEIFYGIRDYFDLLAAQNEQGILDCH